MTNNKSENIVPAKKAAINAASQKHSAPFYISNSLFNNKRLKQKRLKRAANTYKKKTERTRRDYSTLKADITIDLLTDDEGQIEKSQMKSTFGEIIPQLGTFTAQRQQIFVYPTSLQPSEFPNTKFIPMQGVPPLHSFEKRINCKRKSRQPKRLTKPTIVNNESIVLSDSDTEVAAQDEQLTTSTPFQQTSPNGPFISKVAQVEEVTVSLVPRTSGGSCSKPSVSELFPMAPDETTVHTIIANRIYELPLNKLREGLASCSVVEENEKPQSTGTVTRKSTPKINSPKVISPPLQSPISLKLSSDLSISLISDEEEEESNEKTNAEKLRMQQPHLSIQQFHMPVTAADNRQVPKRRKLG